MQDIQYIYIFLFFYLMYSKLFTPSNKVRYYKTKNQTRRKGSTIQISQTQPFLFAFLAWFDFCPAHNRKILYF